MYVRLYFKINFSGYNIFLAWYNTGSISDTSAYPTRKRPHDVGSCVCRKDDVKHLPGLGVSGVLATVSGVRGTYRAAVAAGLTVLLLDEHRRLMQAAQVAERPGLGTRCSRIGEVTPEDQLSARGYVHAAVAGCVGDTDSSISA